jgi:hypothetical protein
VRHEEHQKFVLSFGFSSTSPENNHFFFLFINNNHPESPSAFSALSNFFCFVKLFLLCQTFSASSNFFRFVWLGQLIDLTTVLIERENGLCSEEDSSDSSCSLLGNEALRITCPAIPGA